MKELKPILIGLCFVTIFIGGFTMGKQETQPQKPTEEPAIAPQYLYYEALNEAKEVDSNPDILNNDLRNNHKNYNYSDEEIRILREKQSFKSDGGYIYTPGRIISD